MYADDLLLPSAAEVAWNNLQDPRVVKPESDQIVERLRARGVEVRYDVYEDEGHGFTKRENEIKAMKDTALFMETYLARE